MDAKKDHPNVDGYSAIELSSPDRHGHLGQPGLEVVDYSSLEVVSPRPNLSHSGTWEKASDLPQVAAAPYGHSPSFAADGASPGLGTSYSAVAPSYEYMSPNGRFRPAPPPPPRDGFFRQDVICGVKRQLFWIIVAVGVFLMVAAVAIGVGLGVALNHSGDSTPSSTTTPLPSANSSSPSATTLPLPTATGVTGPELQILCPANNLTLYTAAGTGLSYLLLCGRDYSSLDGATDLFHEPLDSVSDCIDECARQQGCVGAGYGNYNGKDTCWLKSRLGNPNVSPQWYFAVLDNVTLPAR